MPVRASPGSLPRGIRLPPECQPAPDRRNGV